MWRCACRPSRKPETCSVLIRTSAWKKGYGIRSTGTEDTRFKDVRIIVAGASGFVGRNLLVSLPPDWEAVALYHKSRNFPAFAAGLHNKNVTALACDLSDPEDVRKLVREAGSRFDQCVYLAGNSDPA